METVGLRVAIVDDDASVRRALRRLISSLSFRPIEFASGEAFLTGLHEEPIYCALVDLHMPELNGIDLLARMRAEGSAIPAFIITGADAPKMREKCIKAGAAGYLLKPIDRSAVATAINSLAAAH